MKADGIVEEVHVVDWFPKHQAPVTNGYRRLDAYLESTLLQLGREGVSTSGIVQVSCAAFSACLEHHMMCMCNLFSPDCCNFTLVAWKLAVNSSTG